MRYYAILATSLAAITVCASARTAPPAIPGCASMASSRVADSVAAAFETHQVVLIGSTHGDRKPHEFLLCLLSRPALQRHTPDVLVEWANPVHQTLVDRYLLTLEPILADSLERVWFDTDAPELWARLPLIPEFYAAVRDINAQLPVARRLRVLGGSEPIDWSLVRTTQDVTRYPFKTNWAAHLLSEHFAPDSGRRVLVVYGDAHIQREGGNLVSRLSARERANMFVVGTIEAPDSADLASIARLGDPAHPFFLGKDRFPAEGPYPRRLFYVREKPLSAYVDAVVYLGAEPNRDAMSPSAFTGAQKTELARRDSIEGDLRQLLRLRNANAAEWFRAHPRDLPPDPRR